MKKLVLFFMFLGLLTCQSDDSSDDGSQDPDFPTNNITGNIVLPQESTIDPNNLEVQSLVGSSIISNFEYSTSIIGNDDNTLYVTDELNRVILMGYSYPNQSDYTIDSGSTLVAMVMNQPFAQTLSLQGKIDLVQDIRSRDDFEDMKAQIEEVLIQGLSPLDTTLQSFGEQLAGFFNSVIQQADRSNNNSDQPANIIRAGRNLIFQNPGKSYTSYVGVYKGQQRLAQFKLGRVNFVPTSVSEILLNLTGLSDGPDVVEQEYTLPNEDGDYDIRIRTGKQALSELNDEGVKALQDNILDISTDILFEAIPYDNDNIQCTIALYNDFKEYLTVVDDFNNVSTPQEMLSYCYDKINNYLNFRQNLLTGCNPPGNNVTDYLEAIQKKLTWLKWVGILGNAGNFATAAYQWTTDDSVLNLCYNVTDGVAIECEPNLNLSGNLQFGEVPINTEKESILFLTNSTDQNIEVSSIELPDNFTASWTSGTITPGQTQEVTITFLPNALEDFEGIITVNNDFNQDTNTIEANGTGVPAFTLTGDLNYGDVSINTSLSKILTITNAMDQPLQVTSIDLPNGFTPNWLNGTIPANGVQEVSIIFIPNEVQSYDGTVTVNNDIDQVNNTIAITGNGVEEQGEILLSGDLNFGNVEVNTSQNKTFSISNESTFTINISSIVLPDGYTADWNSVALEAGTFIDVIVTFTPTQVQNYDGTITVNNDTDQVNNTIDVIGSGINNSPSAEVIEIISGNNQAGEEGQELLEPLVTIVKDNQGNPVSGQQVYFEVVSGGGSVNQLNVTSNGDGLAQTTWTLGNNNDAQSVEASILDDTNNTIDFVTFTATVENAECTGLSSFTDPRDGQVYPIVQIGNQTWFAANLNFDDGNSWCYDDNPSNCDTYGRMYDWQSALNACPNGWHLPTDAEWTQLTDFLGGSNVAGGEMKSTSSLWTAPNTGATNSSCFSGLPGGRRNTSSTYGSLGSFGYWWSSTLAASNPNRYYMRGLSSSDDNVTKTFFSENNGICVRCVMD